MWVIVRPLTRNTGLGQHRLLTSFIHMKSELRDDNIPSVVSKTSQIIRKALPNFTTQLSSEAETVARDWSRCMMNTLLSISTKSNSMCAKKRTSVTGRDIDRAIKSLTGEICSQALGICFWETYKLQGKTTMKAISTFKACLPFLYELGDVFTVLDECESLWDNRIDGAFKCSITSDGKALLLEWIGETLIRAINQAGRSSNKGLKRITGSDVLNGLEWERLKLFPPPKEMKKNQKRKRSSKGVSDKEFITCIPCDVLESLVLPKLPLKSLSRFNSVSSQWRQLISNASIIKSREGHSNVSLAVYNYNHQVKYERFSSDCDDLEVVLLDTVSFNGKAAHFYASCCGIMCFAVYRGRNRWHFITGNPATKQWQLLPQTMYQHSNNGILHLGPGLIVNASGCLPSYKLVVPVYGSNSHLFEVFSSEEWTWKALHAKLDQEIAEAHRIDGSGYSECIDNTFYYATKDSANIKLIWLDTQKDTADIIDLPVASDQCALGSLRKQSQNTNRSKTLTCTIPIEGRKLITFLLADKKKWEPLFNIPVNGINVIPYPYNGGEICIVQKDEDLFSYDKRTERWTIIARGFLEFITFDYRVSLCALPEMPRK